MVIGLLVNSKLLSERDFKQFRYIGEEGDFLIKI